MTDSARLETWEIGRLRPAPHNPRHHAEDDLAELAASIRRFGFRAPILATADGEIVAGEGRWRAAQALDLETVPVVPVEDLTAQELQAYLIADNRVAELSTWDAAELGQALEQLEDLDGVGFTDEDLAGFGIMEPPRPNRPRPSLDEIDPPAVPVVQYGSVWTLGRHRVLCGDSTKSPYREGLLLGESVDLVLTDPPYAIYGSSSGVGSAVADDRMVRAFFSKVLHAAGEALKVFGHAYVFSDWRSWSAWWESGRPTALSPANMLVWNKGGFGLGNHYVNCHELIGFWHRLPPEKTMRSGGPTGQRSVHKPNVLNYPRTGRGDFEKEERERFHNAAKPVDLLRYLVVNSTDKGERVLDLFLGAGSVLLACELEDRTCLGLEIEPAWVEVTVRRWETLTGETARDAEGHTLEDLRAAAAQADAEA